MHKIFHSNIFSSKVSKQMYIIFQPLMEQN